jgi:phage terminase small subunit
MALHTQPVEIALLKGADKKHPERYRNEVPKSKLPLGGAPEHLTPAAADCWFEISSYAIPGVMTGADRVTLEMLANLLAEYREGPREFPSTKLGQLIGLLGRFGMSPSDRTKLGVAKNKEEDPYSNLDD